MEEFLNLKTHICLWNLEDKRDQLSVNSCMLGVSLKHTTVDLYLIFLIYDIWMYK